MGEEFRQNSQPQDFTNWTDKLEELFSINHLNFGRFRHRTESGIEPDSDSYAKAFKRQLSELDKITNNSEYFSTYLLLPTHPAITFEDRRITQGYHFHVFNQSNPYTATLLALLWKHRKIETEDGRQLRAGKPIPLIQIYKELNLTHERFDLTVRAIHAATHRKDIDLKIKYPEHHALLVLVQDSV